MSKSSKRWLQEHAHDEYVQRALQCGYRSRAAFKLLEIAERDRLFQGVKTIVDLGAAPGGWSQIAAHQLAGRGRIVALDCLAMPALNGVDFLQADFTTDEALSELQQLLADQSIDLVLSDMAPNMSGHKDVDQARAMLLAELALDFACQQLRPGGDFLVKVFQGSGIEEFQRNLRSAFDKVMVRKPKASRARSAELYYLARGKKG